MPYNPPAPTGRSVHDLHYKLIRDWDERLHLDQEFQDLVHQRNRIENLDELDRRPNMRPIQLHAGRAGGIIEHANGLLMVLPEFNVEPLSLNTEDARSAEQVERFTAAVFQQQLLANDFWTNVGRDVLIYARAFIKALPLPSVWTIQAGYPVRDVKQSATEYLKVVREWKETEGKFPFVIQHVPALSILPLLDTSDNMIASIEEKQVTVRLLVDDMDSPEVQELVRRGSLKWWDQVTVVEYMDDTYIGYFLVDTTPYDRSVQDVPAPMRVKSYIKLRAWKHGLGRHPIVMIPGIKTEMADLKNHFKSFLSDAKESLEMYDFLLSRMATMVWAYYLPSYKWQLADTTAAFAGRDRPILDVNLGGVTVIYQDEELDAMPVPQGLPDASILLQETDDMIQRHTLEDVLFGRVSGNAPAFQVNLRIQVAKSKLIPLALHMATGLTNVMDLLFRGVEQLGEAVVVNGEKITVKMARQHRGRITAQIEPKSPQDRNADIGAANMALQFGLPWDWIVEHILSIPDPATLRLQKDILEIEQLPAIKERLMQDVLAQLEALIEEDETENLAGVDMSELPPGFAEAVQQFIGGGGMIQPGVPLPPLSRAESAQAPGLGRGPFPPGGAPQSIQGGRGLMTERAQPSPPSPQVGTTGPAIPGGPGVP